MTKRRRADASLAPERQRITQFFGKGGGGGLDAFLAPATDNHRAERRPVAQCEPDWRPRSLCEMAVCEPQLAALRGWFAGVRERPALVLSGPIGCGKTTLVRLLCEEHGLRPVELNGSLDRSRTAIRDTVGEAARHDCDGRTVVIVEDMDCISNGGEASGVAELARVMKSTKTPIVCVSNNPKFAYSRLKNLAVHVCLPRPDQLSVAAALERVCGSSVPTQYLVQIAQSCGGDVRQAVTHLQALVRLAKHTGVVPEEHMVRRVCATGSVDRELSAFELASRLFARQPTGQRSNLSDPMLAMIVHENLSHVARGCGSIAYALECISHADAMGAKVESALVDFLRVDAPALAVAADTREGKIGAMRFPKITSNSTRCSADPYERFYKGLLS